MGALSVLALSPATQAQEPGLALLLQGPCHPGTGPGSRRGGRAVGGGVGSCSVQGLALLGGLRLERAGDREPRDGVSLGSAGFQSLAGSRDRDGPRLPS